jgi:hypothetical protein
MRRPGADGGAPAVLCGDRRTHQAHHAGWQRWLTRRDAGRNGSAVLTLTPPTLPRPFLPPAVRLCAAVAGQPWVQPHPPMHAHAGFLGFRVIEASKPLQTLSNPPLHSHAGMPSAGQRRSSLVMAAQGRRCVCRPPTTCTAVVQQSGGSFFFHTRALAVSGEGRMK